MRVEFLTWKSTVLRTHFFKKPWNENPTKTAFLCTLREVKNDRSAKNNRCTLTNKHFSVFPIRIWPLDVQRLRYYLVGNRLKPAIKFCAQNATLTSKKGTNSDTPLMHRDTILIIFEILFEKNLSKIAAQGLLYCTDFRLIEKNLLTRCQVSCRRKMHVMLVILGTERSTSNVMLLNRYNTFSIFLSL